MFAGAAQVTRSLSKNAAIQVNAAATLEKTDKLTPKKLGYTMPGAFPPLYA